jgi:hypothetical protein
MLIFYLRIDSALKAYIYRGIGRRKRAPVAAKQRGEMHGCLMCLPNLSATNILINLIFKFSSISFQLNLSQLTMPPKRAKAKPVLPPPRRWAKAHPRFLKPELARRGLPSWGTQSTLIARLKASDAPTNRTFESRKSSHQRALKRLQNASLSKIIPFPQFQNLPLEIREYIWDLSLPGPRVLTLGENRYAPNCERLFFSRLFKARNPVALKVCKESRTVAKRRYKLCFGTGNVYADLKGGDILYFGPEYLDGHFLDTPWEILSETIWPEAGTGYGTGPIRVMKSLSEGLIRDLESVKHLAIARNLWNAGVYARFSHVTIGGIARGYHHGEFLRKRLRKWKGLERISLEHGVERIENPVHEVFIGGPVIEDPGFEKKPIDWRKPGHERLNVQLYKSHAPEIGEWIEGRKEIEGELNAVALLSRFDTMDLSDEEKERGIPEARLVDIKYVIDEPRRLREDFWRRDLY